LFVYNSLADFVDEFDIGQPTSSGRINAKRKILGIIYSKIQKISTPKSKNKNLIIF
jgi:hypothetical protein